MSEKIKQCSTCFAWMTIEEIMYDRRIRPIGMTYDTFANKAYFFFQHDVPGCGTSFMLNVEYLKSYIEEEIPDKVIALSEHCELHCTRISDLGACSQECRNAPYRRLLNKMVEHKTRTAETPDSLPAPDK